MKIQRKHTKWAIVAAGVIAFPMLGAAACSSSGQPAPPSGNQQESQQQQADTNTLETNQPLPHFNSSQERQNMIDIETAEADDVETTSFFMHNGSPDPVGSCPSIGFGLPDSASLSNPAQAEWNSGGSNGNYGVAGVTIGQMDPTGIYAPTSSEGTFVICLSDSGQPYIDRIEDSVDTAGGPATWNYTLHRFELTGAPTAAASVTTSVPSSGKDVNKAASVAGKK